MSAKVGTRRLLIALSSLYWIAAVVYAAVFAFDNVGRCDAALPALNAMNDALWKQEFYACRDALLPLAAIMMVCALVVFGLMWAVYLTTRWVIRGYRGAA